MRNTAEWPLTALGVYIFAGGFTLGVKRAGFDVLAQLEDGPYGGATTRRNHPGMPLHDNPATWPLKELAGQVDFIYGNPPCAPFSNAGISTKKTGQMGDWWKRDPRTSCITKMFNALEVVQPAVWAWESVQPALRRGREMVDELTAIAREHGYAATYVLLNAEHLGVPQTRRRFFCVFHRVAIAWSYPTAAERPALRRTVRDAWAPLATIVDDSPIPPSPTKNPEHLALLHGIAPGGSLRRAWEQVHPPETHERNAHGGVKGRPRFLDVRLDWERPSPTLTGGATKFHPVEDRYITLLEQQLLCGYPADYVFEGPNLSNKYAQTAQAVMPPVGQWLAENVARAILAGVPADPAVATLADLENERTGPAGPEFRSIGGPAPIRERKTRTEDHVEAPIAPAPVGSAAPAAPPAAALRPETPATTVSVDPGPLARGVFKGPTDLARALIADGQADVTILAATRAAFGPGSPRPLKFTGTDLRRLRERITRTTITTGA